MSRFGLDDDEHVTSKRHVEIACEVLSETKHAYRICDGVNTVWVPKSQVEHHKETDPRKRASVIVMPEWLAQEKGLI